MAIKKKSFLPKLGTNAKLETKDVDCLTPATVSSVADELNSPAEPTLEGAESTEQNNNDTAASPKRHAFLPTKFNFSPVRKSKPQPEKEDDEPALFNVACETGNNVDCNDDEDMSVEVNMAAASRCFEDDDSEEVDAKHESSDNVTNGQVAAAEETKKRPKSDDDIDLVELANEIKSKFKKMLKRDKPVKTAHEPELPQEANIVKSTFDGKASGNGAASVEIKADEVEKPNDVPTDMSVDQDATEKEKKKAKDDDDIDLVELANEVKNKLKKLLVKNKSVKSETSPMPEPELTHEADAAKSSSPDDMVKVDATSDNPAQPELGSEEEVKKEQYDSAPKKVTFMFKFFRSDEKSEKSSDTATPSIPRSQEDDVAEERTNTKTVHFADEKTSDKEAKESNEEKVIDVGTAKSPGVRSKFTKLFSKNDASSVDATRSEPGVSKNDAKNDNGLSLEPASLSKDFNDDAPTNNGQSDMKATNEADKTIKSKAETESLSTSNVEAKTSKGFKSKFIRKLGIAGAAGALCAGGAVIKPSDESSQGSSRDETSDEISLEVIVHSEKPVSEADKNDSSVLESSMSTAEEEVTEDNEPNVTIESVELDPFLTDNEPTRQVSIDDDGLNEDGIDDMSVQDERAEAEHSRCGLPDKLHDALLDAGQLVYDAIGDPSDFGTAKRIVGVMEATESVCSCFRTPVDQNDNNDD